MLELGELDGEMMLEKCERKAPLVTAVIGHGARHRQQRTARLISKPWSAFERKSWWLCSASFEIQV